MAKASTSTRYVNGMTVPKSVGKGRVLMHNRVLHTLDMPCGVNGFRAWTDSKPSPGYKLCACGWSGLAHYSGFPNIKCKPGSWLDDRREENYTLGKLTFGKNVSKRLRKRAYADLRMGRR